MPEPEPIWQSEASVPANSRGLAYGDGLFETILVCRGRPWLLDAHIERLALGAARLDLNLNVDHVVELVEAALEHAGEREWCVLKLVATRVPSARGYAYTDSASELLISVHAADAWPEQVPAVATRVAQTRLAVQPVLAGIKHLNRLEQVIARAEHPSADYPELILLDADGWVTEGVSANLFAVIDDQLCTPVLDRCGVAGVVRSFVMSTRNVAERRFRTRDLLGASEVFLTNSLRGVWRVASVSHDGVTHDFSGSEISAQVRETLMASL